MQAPSSALISKAKPLGWMLNLNPLKSRHPKRKPGARAASPQPADNAEPDLLQRLREAGL